jgi:glycosyltransferase involved in cell wall biosynthesis
VSVRVLILIPAYNEADSLPAVIREFRSLGPGMDLLVVDDGSEDATPSLLGELGVQRLRLPVRQGVGTAVRTGLRYARACGYDAVIRFDGDGQHPSGFVDALLAPLAAGAADVAIGSRYALRRRPKAIRFSRRLMHYALGRILSLLTGRTVTDPTSGLWAFGPRAIDLLADHHPSGYPEPELYLFIHRNGLTTVEVPVEMRERLAGQSSLTLHRSGAALLRLLILLAVVPLRGPARGR